MNALGFAKTLRSLAGIRSQVAVEARDKFFALLDDGFNAGTDPYGTPWAAISAEWAARKGHSLPGTHTYAMRGTLRVETQGGAGLVMTVGAPHAMFFDKARRLLPDNGLPASWREALAAIYAARLKKGFGR